MASPNAINCLSIVNLNWARNENGYNSDCIICMIESGESHNALKLIESKGHFDGVRVLHIWVWVAARAVALATKVDDLMDVSVPCTYQRHRFVRSYLRIGLLVLMTLHAVVREHRWGTHRFSVFFLSLCFVTAVCLLDCFICRKVTVSAKGVVSRLLFACCCIFSVVVALLSNRMRWFRWPGASASMHSLSC